MALVSRTFKTKPGIKSIQQLMKGMKINHAETHFEGASTSDKPKKKKKRKER